MSYYNTNPGQPESVTSDWILKNTGMDPATTPPATLAAKGYYKIVVLPEPAYNPELVSIDSKSGIVEYDYVVESFLVPFPVSTYVSSVKATAYNILEPTDWLVVRKVENGTEIPTDWGTWRESIRLEAQTKNATIETATPDELVAYVQSPAYTYWPPEPAVPAVA